MLYEIINPSDPYTIEADDLEIAAVACYLISDGEYALKRLDDENGEEVPLLSPKFGIKPDVWFKEKFGRTLQESYNYVVKEKLEEFCTCLESVMIGKEAERASYKKGLELITDPLKQKKWKEHWHDQRRSSMNDIGSYAWKNAEAHRKIRKV